MLDGIPISLLNDFSFCPYSIYLHNIYRSADEELYYALPQFRGKEAHRSIDQMSASTRKEDLISLSINSKVLGIYGKIDLFRRDERLLIERKYQLRKIYKGNLIQLWAQYFCMKEMGYDVERLAFYEISTNRMLEQDLPSEANHDELRELIWKFRNFDLRESFPQSESKCSHCIYSALCEKTDVENVYT